MAKIKVKLQNLCLTDAAGQAPFMNSLRAVRRQSLPAKTFYWLNKISVLLEKEFAEYEAARVQLVLALGVKTETGFAVPPEKGAEFQKQLAELDSELELPIEEGVKLPLPATAVAEDWFILMAELDIFEEPK